MTDCNDESLCPLYTGEPPNPDCAACMKDTAGDMKAHEVLDDRVLEYFAGKDGE